MKAMRFVALIPHRDCKPKLDPYKAELFASDFFGAYSFPLAAPLAQVSHPLTKNELKRIALALREATLAQGGKITASGLSVADFPAGLRLLGLGLDAPIPVEAIPHTVPHTVPGTIAVAVIRGEALSAAPPPPSLTFSAASIANLVIRPLCDDGYSFEWKIGIPVWLPAVKKSARPHAPKSH